MAVGTVLVTVTECQTVLSPLLLFCFLLYSLVHLHFSPMRWVQSSSLSNIWGKWSMERWGDVPRDAQPGLVELGTPPGSASWGSALTEPPCSTPFHVVTSAQCTELRASPNSGLHVSSLSPSRPISPSLWETPTLETSQRALLRGKGSYEDWEGTWGQGEGPARLPCPPFSPAALLSWKCNKPWCQW